MLFKAIYYGKEHRKPYSNRCLRKNGWYCFNRGGSEMKELSIKEKAKRYDEAIERAKGAHNSAKSDKENGVTDKITEYTIQLTETIFPELKMSEDERIRGNLIELFHDTVSNDEIFSDYGLDKTEVLAWLEKQGQCEQRIAWSEEDEYLLDETTRHLEELIRIDKAKHCGVDVQFYQRDIDWLKSLKERIQPNQGNQKSTDKVEPKFKVGDWVVYCGKTCEITGLHNGVFTITNQDGSYFFNQVESTTEPAFHLWTIEDAKDGDVLVCGDNPNDHHVEVIMIFKSLRNKLSAFTHFHIFYNEFRTDNWCNCGKNAHPATKEQRDQLEKAMANAGYRWNKEKLKLEKI